MGYELDFLPVGEESSPGDATVLRYGDLYSSRDQQKVIVVDGGFKDSGEALVNHISSHYNTKKVDVVVSTHPDQDHSSGLSVVLEECKVGELWMHLPWQHSQELATLSASRFKSQALSEYVQVSLQNVSDLAGLAKSKGIPIVEPFTGVQTDDGVFRVLGPTQAYYEELLREMAEGKSVAQKLVAALGDVADKADQKLLPESLYDETLTDSGETSSRNNTSVVSLLQADGRHSMLTGDAGVPALEKAADELEAIGVTTDTLRFIQVPHHGSRRNVGPTILDRLLGPKGQESQLGTACVSAPNKNPEKKHPSKKVTNAFRRRGYPVYATQGKTTRHHHQAPERPWYSEATPLPFYSQVEADGDD